jgi:hypothetical protein
MSSQEHSMQRISRYAWWSAALVTMIVLAAVSRPRISDSASSSPPIDEWSIHELVEHLNRMGVEVQLRSTQADGVLRKTVFLTTGEKDWRALNALHKDAKRIGEWHGILYCEHAGKGETDVARLWGDRCLAVGPFRFMATPSFSSAFTPSSFPKGDKGTR